MTVESSGTLTASTSEQDLGTVTGAKTVVLVINTVNMVNGDAITLRAYRKVLTGDTLTACLAYSAYYQHRQGNGGSDGDVVKLSPPMPSPFSAKFTLQQTAGTARAFPWSIESF